MGPQHAPLTPQRIPRVAVYYAASTGAAALGLGSVRVACARGCHPDASLFGLGVCGMGPARSAHRPSLVAVATARSVGVCDLAGGIFRQPYRVAGTPLRAPSGWPLRTRLVFVEHGLACSNKLKHVQLKERYM